MKTMRMLPVALLLLGGFLGRDAQAFCNPQTGQGLSRDPIAEEGGLNLYGAVENNPVNFFDSLGLAGYNPCGRVCARSAAGCRACCAQHPDTDACRKPPQYPVGFALCRREFQRNGTEGFFEAVMLDVGDWAGGEHTYVQYVECTKCPPQGWGFSGGPARPNPDEEKAFNPTSCKPCKRTGGTLKYGSGKDTKGTNASDAEIADCINNAPIRKNYSKKPGSWYVCSTWASEAIGACGLDCN